MKTDLKDRIEAFTKEFERLHFLDKKERLADFILTELDAKDKPYKITGQDLAFIHSRACSLGTHTPTNVKFDGIEIRNNQSSFLALTWSGAVLSWLRSKGMLHFNIDTEGE